MDRVLSPPVTVYIRVLLKAICKHIISIIQLLLGGGSTQGMGKGTSQEITLGLELSQMRCRSCGSTTWNPKVCKIMAFMAIIMGLGVLFYILLGSR